MPWEEVPIDENFNPVPTTTRVDIKIEDIHRMDLPGCPRHPTAGAIQQHSSWSDPDGRHNRFTGVVICAECSAKIMDIDPRSMPESDFDTTNLSEGITVEPT